MKAQVEPEAIDQIGQCLEQAAGTDPVPAALAQLGKAFFIARCIAHRDGRAVAGEKRLLYTIKGFIFTVQYCKSVADFRMVVGIAAAGLRLTQTPGQRRRLGIGLGPLENSPAIGRFDGVGQRRRLFIDGIVPLVGVGPDGHAAQTVDLVDGLPGGGQPAGTALQDLGQPVDAEGQNMAVPGRAFAGGHHQQVLRRAGAGEQVMVGQRKTVQSAGSGGPDQRIQTAAPVG